MEYYHGCKQQNEFPGNKIRCTLSNGIYELTCWEAARTKPRLAVMVTARKWSPVPKIIFVLERKNSFLKNFHQIEHTLVWFSHFLVEQRSVRIDNQEQQLTKVLNIHIKKNISTREIDILVWKVRLLVVFH